MMKTSIENIRNKLIESGLKITPQRMAILEAIYNLENHPKAENIIDYIKKMHPNIATGTVYKVLGTLVDNQLIQKVKTEKDITRYDGIMENHHHLYCSETDLIEDYIDGELDKILKEYFKKKRINDFIIEEITLQIKGKFNK